MADLKKQRKRFIEVHNEYEGLYHGYAQKAGMSEIPFRILCAVSDSDGPLSQVDVCRLWNFPKQSVNTAIARLVRENYVRLEQDRKAAGNRKIIELTEKGREYCRLWIDPLIEADTKAFGMLTEEEQNLYIDLLKRQRDSLQESLDAAAERNEGLEIRNEK